MSRHGLWLGGLAFFAFVLMAAWWGWQRGGLALMQLGVGIC